MRSIRFFPSAICTLLLLPIGCTHTPPGVDAARLHQPDYILATPREPSDSAVPGVDNFAVISKDVWRGAAPTKDGLNVLAQVGVKTMIDLREEADDSDRIPAGVKYIRLPVSPWHADRVDVKKALEAIDRSEKPVFIHCQQGRDRTGLVIGAYRLTQGMSLDDACKELRNFNVNPWWRDPIERRLREFKLSAASQAARASD